MFVQYNGVLELCGTGYPTLSYQVQASTNLSSTNWTTIGISYAGSTGDLNFTDANAAGPARFYRLVSP